MYWITYCVQCTGSRIVFNALDHVLFSVLDHVLRLVHWITYCVRCTGSRIVFPVKSLADIWPVTFMLSTCRTSRHQETVSLSCTQGSISLLSPTGISMLSSFLIIKIIQMGAFHSLPFRSPPDPGAAVPLPLRTPAF